MKINSTHYHSIWLDEYEHLFVINQRLLPHRFEIIELKSLEDICFAIETMIVRGAPLIGVTASYGVFFAVKQYFNNFSSESTSIGNFEEYLNYVCKKLITTRPTAVNLEWAVDKISTSISNLNSIEEILWTAKNLVISIDKSDVEICKSIGNNGFQIIKQIAETKQSPVNIMTHCNAGWLATVDYGTALAPIYVANEYGIPLHVWVSETRPRNQGSFLTAFELLNEKITHTLVVDNACGHLMQQGLVDLVIVGADRIAANGDTANKIGTYLKALAAKDNNIPFYVATPNSTFDKRISSGQNIIVEERTQDEVLYLSDTINKIRIAPEGTSAINYGFDITPANLITGFIRE